MLVLDEPHALPDETRILVEAPAHEAEFRRSTSLVELAKLQGVSAPATAADLPGGRPTDELDDGFEEDFLRGRELEAQRP
jgi:hypothetical protein